MGCGVLIEHFAGHFPTWLAPEQIRVLTISEKADEFANDIFAQLKAAGLLDPSVTLTGRFVRKAGAVDVAHVLREIDGVADVQTTLEQMVRVEIPGLALTTRAQGGPDYLRPLPRTAVTIPNVAQFRSRNNARFRSPKS